MFFGYTKATLPQAASLAFCSSSYHEVGTCRTERERGERMRKEWEGRGVGNYLNQILTSFKYLVSTLNQSIRTLNKRLHIWITIRRGIAACARWCSIYFIELGTISSLHTISSWLSCYNPGQGRTNDFGTPGLSDAMGPFHVGRDKVLSVTLLLTIDYDTD